MYKTEYVNNNNFPLIRKSNAGKKYIQVITVTIYQYSIDPPTINLKWIFPPPYFALNIFPYHSTHFILNVFPSFHPHFQLIFFFPSLTHSLSKCIFLFLHPYYTCVYFPSLHLQFILMYFHLLHQHFKNIVLWNTTPNLILLFWDAKQNLNWQSWYSIPLYKSKVSTWLCNMKFNLHFI